jgi:hypothetical protein
MKTLTKQTTIETTDLVIIMRMLGNRTAELRFSDHQQGRNFYDYIRNSMVFAGEAIREIKIK